mmetsp:Transcript_29708/g.66643  ORF Transcript_29708/g.66643 Transcript_29708/m.66643 type:complete len:202 (+) Transcript_29708:157-762(+)
MPVVGSTVVSPSRTTNSTPLSPPPMSSSSPPRSTAKYSPSRTRGGKSPTLVSNVIRHSTWLGGLEGDPKTAALETRTCPTCSVSSSASSTCSAEPFTGMYCDRAELSKPRRKNPRRGRGGKLRLLAILTICTSACPWLRCPRTSSTTSSEASRPCPARGKAGVKGIWSPRFRPSTSLKVTDQAKPRAFRIRERVTDTSPMT